MLGILGPGWDPAPTGHTLPAACAVSQAGAEARPYRFSWTEETILATKVRPDRLHKGNKPPGARNRPPNAGMTLIEILVAVTLLGLLSAGIVASLDAGATAWQRTRSRLTLDRRIATANSILHAELSGIAPVRAETPPGRQIGLPNFLFFQGEPESMRFVSSYSITQGRRGGLQIVELQIGNSSRGRRVLLNQMLYRGPRSIGSLVEGYLRDPSYPRGRLLFRPIEARPTSLVIIDELAQCSFAYLKAPRTFSGSTTWVSHWDEPEGLPEAVAIRLLPRAGDARLVPVSIVADIPAQGAAR